MKLNLSIFPLSALALIACGEQKPRATATALLVSANSNVTNTLPAHCLAADVVTVERHENINDSNSPKFAYLAKHVKALDAKLPTVISLPGGPGQTGMEADTSEDFPEGWGVVEIDPRGVGCNEHTGGLHPETFYTTEAIASDVAAVIEKLGLKNFIIYGVSYGTLHGTVLAKQIEDAGLPAPIAVVHEGVLGRAFRTDEDPYSDYVRLWNEIRDALPTPAQKALIAVDPLGAPAASWLKFLMTYLMIAEISHDGIKQINPLSILLHQVSEDPSNAQNQIVKNLVTESGLEPEEMSESQKQLYKYVACNEITEHAAFQEFVFEKGELKLDRSKFICGPLRLTAPFDSAKLSTPYRTYYFSGTHDPATAPWQGEYHFANNTRAQRTHVSLMRAGHNPINGNLGNCKQQVWSSIAGDGTDLEDALKVCAATEVTVKHLSAHSPSP